MHLEWGRAYYHFCRYHEALHLPATTPRPYRSRTPAMAHQRLVADAATACLMAKNRRNAPGKTISTRLTGQVLRSTMPFGRAF